jgi:type I restriction enzyme M protein
MERMAELSQKQKEFLEIGEKEGLIKIQDHKITYTFRQKSFDFTHPEEPIRASTYVALIHEYNYPKEKIDLEVYPPRREPKLPADIVVFKDEELKHAYIVVETKADSNKASIDEAKREGLGNANLFRAPFLLCVCKDKWLAYDLRGQVSSWEALDEFAIPDIPRAYSEEAMFIFGNKVGTQLKPVSGIKDFRNLISRCHDVLRDYEKKAMLKAFYIISRLLFIKLYDEKNTPNGQFYSFQIGFGENPRTVAERIKSIYAIARKKEPRIFPEDLGISRDETFMEIAKILGPYSLRATDLDVKGEAYQSFLDSLFRGSWGQYFTPRNIVKMMVKMVDPREDTKVIDPACGTGGFLLYTLYHVRSRLEGKYSSEDLREKFIDFAYYNLYGIEIDPDLAQVAIAGMLVHEDAHSHIITADALAPLSDLRFYGISEESFDIVLTNPPLGSIEKRKDILENFTLGRGRNQQVSQALFVERALELVRPGGCVCTIISEDVLERDPTFMEFLDNNAYVRAVISLPREAFIPYGSNAKTNILLLQKKGSGVPDIDYCFMAEAKRVGYDTSGETIPLNDFPVILSKWLEWKKENLGDRPW